MVKGEKYSVLGFKTKKDKFHTNIGQNLKNSWPFMSSNLDRLNRKYSNDNKNMNFVWEINVTYITFMYMSLCKIDFVVLQIIKLLLCDIVQREQILFIKFSSYLTIELDSILYILPTGNIFWKGVDLPLFFAKLALC